MLALSSICVKKNGCRESQRWLGRSCEENDREKGEEWVDGYRHAFMDRERSTLNMPKLRQAKRYLSTALSTNPVRQLRNKTHCLYLVALSCWFYTDNRPVFGLRERSELRTYIV